MINLTRRNKRVLWVQGVTGVILSVVVISAFAGCSRDEAKVYHVQKDDAQPPQASQPASAPADAPAQQMATPDAGSMAPPSASLPQLQYKVPEGWQEKQPSEMRVASFTAPSPKGQAADVSVIPMPIIGRDMELLNMWRSQVHLPETTDPNAVKQAEPVTIAGDQGRLFNFVSEQPMIGKSRQRMLIAVSTRGAMSWFFKISGEDAVVTAQKPKFLQFLKSVSFSEGAPAPSQMAAVPTAPSSNANASIPPIWTIPAGWQAVPPSQFLLVEFSVPGSGGAKAEVNVATMGGTGGGVLPNVNRWRGQLGLNAIAESDLPQIAQPLDVPGGKATVVDFEGVNAKTGLPTRLVAVIVLQNDQSWFYKLMGDKQVVAQQKDAFTKFIRSANYANAR
jgi:hypothetical protein